MIPPVRFGFLVPAGNTTIETEFPARLGGAGTAHFQRFTRLVSNEAGVPDTEQAVVDAAQVLSAARVRVMALGYTTGSYYGGIDFDRRVTARITDTCGAKATTAAEAIVSALQALNVERVVVVSPYSKEVNERCEQYLNQAGFRVTAVVGSPPPGPASEVPTEDVARMTLSAPTAGADALLISCTALRTTSLIDDLERSLGIPVVSSNSATLWSVLRLAESAAHLTGLGALFARSAPASPEQP